MPRLGFGGRLAGRGSAGVVGALSRFAYFVYLESSRGQTVGKMALNFKVIGPDGGLPSLEVAMRRNAWLLLSIVPFLGGLVQFVLAIVIGVTINAIRSSGAGTTTSPAAPPSSARETRPRTVGRPPSSGTRRIAPASCTTTSATSPTSPRPASSSRTSRHCWPTPRRSGSRSTPWPSRTPTRGIDLVIGLEARGFLFAAPIAYRLGAGCVPFRKPGKLPYETVEHTYELEYGTDTLAAHIDALGPGHRVLVVDDVLATGGTAAAACDARRASSAASSSGAPSCWSWGSWPDGRDWTDDR